MSHPAAPFINGVPLLALGVASLLGAPFASHAQDSGITDSVTELPQTLEDTLEPDEESQALSSSQALAPELGASLAGEEVTLETTDIATRLSLSTNRTTSQPLAVRTPRDPLSRRTQPRSKVEFQVRGGVEYDDNVFITQDDKVDDVAITVSPTLAVNSGDFRRRQASYISAAYTATGVYYVDDTTDEQLDHAGQVSGQWKRKRATVPFQLQYTRETGSFIDVAGRDTAEDFGGRIGLDYELSSKFAVGVSGEYAATNYELFADSDQYLVDAYLSYQPSRKVILSGVYRYRDAKTDGSDNQTYNAGIARATLLPNSKWRGVVEGGVAFSQLSKGDRSDFIYRLALAYQPNTKQRFSVEAGRRPSTSAFTAGSGYIENGIRMTYEQALGSRTRLVLDGGYQMQDYFAAEEGVSIDRRDEFFTFSALLAYDLSTHWQAEVYYTYSDNDSNDPLVGFDNQRIGMGLTWTY